MKKHKYSKKFIEEIIINPNVSSACKKIGITRNTVYRWMMEDIDFANEYNKARDLGIEYLNDIARNQHLKHLQNGAPWAIKYQLDNHDKAYIRPRNKNYWDEKEGKKKVTGFKIEIVPAKGSPTVTYGDKNRNKI